MLNSALELRHSIRQPIIVDHTSVVFFDDKVSYINLFDSSIDIFETSTNRLIHKIGGHDIVEQLFYFTEACTLLFRVEEDDESNSIYAWNPDTNDTPLIHSFPGSMTILGSLSNSST